MLPVKRVVNIVWLASLSGSSSSSGSMGLILCRRGLTCKTWSFPGDASVEKKRKQAIAVTKMVLFLNANEIIPRFRLWPLFTKVLGWCRHNTMNCCHHGVTVDGGCKTMITINPDARIRVEYYEMPLSRLYVGICCKIMITTDQVQGWCE